MDFLPSSFDFSTYFCICFYKVSQKPLSLSIHFESSYTAELLVHVFSLFSISNQPILDNFELKRIFNFSLLELVEIGPRPVVMALGSVANWGANFLIGTGYMPLHNLLKESVFLVFAFCTFLLLLFVT